MREIILLLITSVFGAGGVGLLKVWLDYRVSMRSGKAPTPQEAAQAQAVVAVEKAEPPGVVTADVFVDTIRALQDKIEQTNRDRDAQIKAMQEDHDRKMAELARRHDSQMVETQRQIEVINKRNSRVVRYAAQLREDMAAAGLKVRDWPDGLIPTT